jgi:hypothetical protein
MAARRAYATQDHNVFVSFTADGHAMGEAYSSGSGARIAVDISDPDAGAAVSRIDLFRGITGTSNAVLVAWSANSSHFEWRDRSVFAPLTEAHYYLRIRMANNASVWTGPVYVTYDPALNVAVGDPGALGTLAMSVTPNPARGDASVEFMLPQADGHVSLAVYDVGGRRVRDLVSGARASGVHRVTWDGRSQTGRPQTGLFFLRLETSRGAATSKVLMLR